MADAEELLEDIGQMEARIVIEELLRTKRGSSFYCRRHREISRME